MLRVITRPHERELMLALASRSCSARHVARAILPTSSSQREINAAAHRLRRQIRHCLARAADPHWRAIAHAHTTWPSPLRDIAALMLMDMSIREIIAALSDRPKSSRMLLSMHQVRTHARTIHALGDILRAELQ